MFKKDPVSYLKDLLEDVHYAVSDDKECTIACDENDIINIQKAIEMIESYETALRNIDTHIRSTPEPVQYIVEELKATLPEYKNT